MENFTLLLKKYADFIVRVGVNPQPGQTLVINCCLEAAPLARLCVRSAYEAGARDVLVNWSDNDVSRSRMELGSEEALTDFKSYQLRRYLDYAESEGGVCVLHILADDPEVYAGLDGAKISRVNAAQRKFMAPWREYTMNDRVQWSIAAMPSAPWAKKMFPELDEAAAIEKLWQLIFDVCRVTNGDPVSEWKAHLDRLTDLKDKMNALDLESVHFESSNGTDLTVGIADKATWESAASVSEKGVVFLPNIPTEEVFTAPHKDKVNGIVYGTKPYVFNGQLIKGFHVTFKDGRVVEHGADEGAELLGRLLDTDEGARSIGEVALVPASSPINRSGALFYSTLFDENAACHIAFGASYPGTTENGTRLSKDELLARGMNQSAIHEDVMVGAEDSHITGKCRDGRTVELFRDGVGRRFHHTPGMVMVQGARERHIEYADDGVPAVPDGGRRAAPAVERAAVMFRSQRLHRRMFHEARPDGIGPRGAFRREVARREVRDRVAAGIVPERVQDDPLRVGQGNEAARSADGVIQLFHDAFGHRHKIRVPIEQLFQRGGAEGHFGGVVRPDPLKAAALP